MNPDSQQCVFVSNDRQLAEAICRATCLDISPLLVTGDDYLSDILAMLSGRVEEPTAICVDASTQFAECPAPSDRGGIELAKHIRLTMALEPLCNMPIVVCTLDTKDWLLRQSSDNIFLFSPKCSLIHFGTGISAIRKAVSGTRPFQSLQQARGAVEPYLMLSSTDKARMQHDYRNRAGIGKFLTEFAGLPEATLAYRIYQPASESELWFKKVAYLDPLVLEGERESLDCHRLQERCRGSKFILVDDQHQRGWSYGLELGLFGTPDQASDSESVLCAAGEACVECFDDFETAFGFFQAKRQQLDGVLEECSEFVDQPSDGRARLVWCESSATDCMPFSLVFIDLRLKPSDEYESSPQHFSGVRLLRMIRELFPALPVVVLSASEKVLSERETRKSGADAYWIKGVSSGKDLREEVLRCLDKADLVWLWMAIEVLERKSYISCYEFGGAERSLLPRCLRRQDDTTLTRGGGEVLNSLSALGGIYSSDHWDRSFILELLKDTFLLLWEGDDLRKPGLHDQDYPYDRVILNMGLLQEMRYNGLFGQEDQGSHSPMAVLRKQLDPVIFDAEKNLRTRRNDMAHLKSSAAYANRPEAIRWVRFTVERLMSET